MTLREAYRILGLTSGASAAETKAAYRRLAATTHPDKGGSAADFIRLRAAYEIVAAHVDSTLDWAGFDDEIPVPAELREVIEAIVADFRKQEEWAEEVTRRALEAFERQMTAYIARASRAELRQIGSRFQAQWNAMVVAIFKECNTRADAVVQRYEKWFSHSSGTVFRDLYRRDLWAFPWRAGFWEAFVVLGVVMGGLSVVIGWGEPWRLGLSSGLLAGAGLASFLIYRWRLRRACNSHRVAEPLAIGPFQMDEGTEPPTATRLRQGRRSTAAFGLGGFLLGSVAAGGLAAPAVGAVAGSVLGGLLDRALNPTEQVRKAMLVDLERFLRVARPQLLEYVSEAHSRLLKDVREKITSSYEERVRKTVRLVTAGSAREGG